MKKILIVNNNLYIGGVQKALVSLLWNIRGKYDITLLLFHPGGAYQADLPPEVKVITPDSPYRYLGMTRADTVTLQDKLGRAFYAAITRLLGRKYAVSLMAMGQKQLGEYDVAVSYLHNGADKLFYGGCNEFVLKHVTAAKKVAFLHCDYTLCGANTRLNAKMYADFDAVAACSQGCADAFLSVNPHLKDRVQVVNNCHLFDRIRQAAEDAPGQWSRDKIHIATVARLGEEKGVERAVSSIARLGQWKEKLHYHIVGDGPYRPWIEKIVEQEGLGDCVTFHGMQANPYGYIKAADLLLIPSYSEAAPLVIGEAACLGTPVLSTETSSAREMVEKAGYGWVCQNSEEAMQKALEDLLADPGALDSAKQRLSALTIDNTTAISQFAQLVQ